MQRINTRAVDLARVRNRQVYAAVKRGMQMVLSNPWLQGFVFLVLGGILGGITGWAVAVHYAREASRDAAHQTTMLERQNRMLQTLLITMEEDKGGALE